jgi:tetratricopeptide (TPR) repeat protein
MADLEGSTGQVWIVLYDYQFNQELLEELGFETRHFQTHLYAMPSPENQGSTLDQVISVYELLVPVADQPSPSCLLEKDLALLYAQDGDFDKAERRLTHALDNCPDRLSGDFIRYNMQIDILKFVYQGAVLSYLEQNKIDDARRVASNLYQLDPHNEVALQALTVFNLFELFENGEAVVDDEGSLEPVRSMQFLMPQTGDSGDVLFSHPPSSISFNITLPEEPLSFVSRIAMDPQSWHWGGDGSTFIITITTEDGDIRELANMHVSKHSEDRRWHDIEASLAPFAGQNIVLTLRTDPGPAGDFSGDWAGWETPRIMQLLHLE